VSRTFEAKIKIKEVDEAVLPTILEALRAK
jgi:hypothetical protein